MRLHTLGPAQTDSYAAAKEYLTSKRVAGQIVLHPSFMEIYQQLSALTGDYLLVPAAYQSSNHESWGQLHYRYLAELSLVDSLITDLAPLALCERPSTKKKIAYTHPATEELLRSEIASDVEVRLSASKVKAYQDFLVDGQYVLTSQKLVKEDPQIKVKKVYTTRMLWSVYQIGG